MKKYQLENLARIRKEDRLQGYQNIGDVYDGYYDNGSYISPFSKTAYNVDSEIMLIAQDWSSVDSLKKKRDEDSSILGYTPGLATNRNLSRFLADAFKMKFSDTYATNIFVFLKEGNISSRIKRSDMIYSAKKYAIPQIEIINPKIVICLGSLTFKILCESAGHKPIPIKDSIEKTIFIGKARVFGVYHTGGMGTANAGGYEKALDTWQQIAKIHKNM